MSGTLAIILGAIALALILIGLGGMWYNRRLKGPSSLSYQVPAVSAKSHEEELSALGILEIKPRTRESEDQSNAVESDIQIIEVEDEDAVDQDSQDEDTLQDEVEEVEDDTEVAAEVEEEIVVAQDIQHDTEDVDSGVEEMEAPVEMLGTDVLLEDASEGRKAGVSRREALFRLLNAVQASVDGYTASLIKKDNAGRCNVEAIVSLNPQAISSQSFVLHKLFNDLLIEEGGPAVLVKDISAEEDTREILNYYDTSVPVRQVAIAPIKAPSDEEESFFLLVDALGWQDLDDPWQRLMIGQFATLLGTFMSTPLTEGESGDYIKPRVRPRREIVAEEIDRARSGNQPLALALIYLNRAEAIAGEGGKAISDAERAMANRLEQAVNGGRLERFGELTYGIFQDEEVSEVEAWALQLQEELLQEGEYFEGGVSIGIALLQDRHKDADEFRADATEALREAFETGACTIIE